MKLVWLLAVKEFLFIYLKLIKKIKMHVVFNNAFLEK